MGQVMRLAFFLLPIALVVTLGRAATADPKTAAEWFNKGDNHYNLGEFDKAIESFRKAFEIEKDDALKPIYLYNIAQAYRQAGDCENAVFFYKRFLSLKANDTKKPLGQSTKDDVLKRIADQEKICADKANNRDKPPEGTMRPEGAPGGDDKTKPVGIGTGTNPTSTPTATTGDPPAGDHTKVATATPTGEVDETGEEPSISTGIFAQPKVLSLRVGAGLGIPKMDPVAVANQFSTSLIGGYPIPLGPKAGVDVGAALSLSPLQWSDNKGGSQTSLFITAVVNAGLRIEVIPRLSLRADAGVGALFFTNVAQGNPFTVDGQAASGGALTMFHVRVGAAAEYALSPNLSLWASPLTFGYSPAKQGLAADTITQLTFLAGAGYRM
jgi:Tetratricopeptide repeat